MSNKESGTPVIGAGNASSGLRSFQPGFNDLSASVASRFFVVSKADFDQMTIKPSSYKSINDLNRRIN